MNRIMNYRVGGHLFVLHTQPGQLSEKELEAYAPFQTADSSGEILFSLTLIGDTSRLPDIGPKIASFQNENGCMTLFSMPDGGISLTLTSPWGVDCCRLFIEPDYQRAKMAICGTVAERHYGFDTAMMMLYAFASAPFDTLLVHASVVDYDGKGYLFLGKSGTGKSTHSRLWTDNIVGASLLNDDNPVVRLTDGKIYVYGTPWSGKTPCYINRRLQVGGFIRLHQAPYNRITPLQGVRAYAALLPSCSCMKWNHEMSESVHRTVVELISTSAFYDLECMPHIDAALLCRDAVVNNISNHR